MTSTMTEVIFNAKKDGEGYFAICGDTTYPVRGVLQKALDTLVKADPMVLVETHYVSQFGTWDTTDKDGKPATVKTVTAIHTLASLQRALVKEQMDAAGRSNLLGQISALRGSLIVVKTHDNKRTPLLVVKTQNTNVKDVGLIQFAIDNITKVVGT